MAEESLGPTAGFCTWRLHHLYLLNLLLLLALLQLLH